MRVQVLDSARLEEREAADWYARESTIAFKRFRAELKQTLKRIAVGPQQFPSIETGFQRALLRTFPYMIIFKQTESDIQVVAISHTSRQPFYWRKRLFDSPSSGSV